MADRLISMEETAKRVSLSKSQVYKLMAMDRFPKSVPVARHRIAFLECEVQNWIDQLVALREAGVGVEERSARAKHASGGRR